MGLREGHAYLSLLQLKQKEGKVKSVFSLLPFCLLVITASCAKKPPAEGPQAYQPLQAAAPGPPAGGSESFWPRFHGPNDDNISTDKGLLQQWPEGGPKLLWTAPGLGEGYASVSIADGLIYTAGSVENQTMVFALDMSGKILWKTPNGPAWTAAQYPGARDADLRFGPPLS